MTDDYDAFGAAVREDARRVEHRALLAYLAGLDGAVLYWQLPAEHHRAAERALADGTIHLDADSDCLVHPDAVRVAGEEGDCWAGWSLDRR